MGKKSSRFQSAVMLFWVFFFITIKFCCANSATRQEAFPENEGKPEDGKLGNTRSVHHIEEYKFRSVKSLFNKKPLLQPKPIILKKKPFIKFPSRIPCIQRLSSNPSIPTFEENPAVHMVKGQHFLLIPFLKSLIPGFNRPASEPIPCARDSKFLHVPRFMRRIPRPLPIIPRPIQFEKPNLEPVPLATKPIPEFEKPISKPVTPIEKPILEDDKPISEQILKDEKHIPKVILSKKKLHSKNKKRISKPISSVRKTLSPPQSVSSIHPESLLLKEYLLKKLFSMIPFPPKFMIPFPAQKPIPPP